jgi:oligopeptide/dipeptide ABC transporter ATP-binding protein
VNAALLTPLLAVRGLEVTFEAASGPVPAVRGVDLDLERGQCLALVGESGSGKSAIGLALARLLPATARVRAARLELAGRELLALDERAMDGVRGRELGVIFQDPGASLDPVMSVGEQVAEGPRLAQGLDAQAARARARELMLRVGLPDANALAERYPHELSGGQQQRVALAMALAGGPGLLIADEPTTALDVSVQARILTLLADLVARERLGLLLITHDLGVVAQASDSVAVVYAGRVVERGSTAALLARPRHPYTAALLRSRPGRAQRGATLQPIPGQAPDPRRLPSGCPFRTRCALARERCAQEEPRLLEVAGAPGALSACFFSAEVPPP